MPELPEVENTIRSLKKLVVGSRIINVWTDTPKLVRKGSFNNLRKGIQNKEIIDIKRKAKNIIILLSGGYAILAHLKMTGHFLLGKWHIKKEAGVEKAVPIKQGILTEKVNGYIHFIFYLDDGRELALSDLRKFAKIIFGKEEDIYKEDGIRDAGPDALEITLNELRASSLQSSKKIKMFLMDQTKIGGIGNIYADDILFKSKINPLRQARSLSLEEIKTIHKSIREILTLSIRLGGTSISDYRDITGAKGGYGDVRLVYRKDGKPCPVCGSSIKKIKLGGRSARFCSACQK